MSNTALNFALGVDIPVQEMHERPSFEIGDVVYVMLAPGVARGVVVSDSGDVVLVEDTDGELHAARWYPTEGVLVPASLIASDGAPVVNFRGRLN